MQPLSALPEWVTLEHQVAQILTKQETHGWYFDESAAWELESALSEELRSIVEVLRARFPFVPGPEFTPKRDNKRHGYVEGATLTRLKEFNPSSRDHIVWILTNYDHFQSETTTTSGKAKMDETALKSHGTGLGNQFLRILEITKLLGMMSQGAPLPRIPDAAIHVPRTHCNRGMSWCTQWLSRKEAKENGTK